MLISLILLQLWSRWSHDLLAQLRCFLSFGRPVLVELLVHPVRLAIRALHLLSSLPWLAGLILTAWHRRVKPLGFHLYFSVRNLEGQVAFKVRWWSSLRIAKRVCPIQISLHSPSIESVGFCHQAPPSAAYLILRSCFINYFSTDHSRLQTLALQGCFLLLLLSTLWVLWLSAFISLFAIILKPVVSWPVFESIYHILLTSGQCWCAICMTRIHSASGRA